MAWKPVHIALKMSTVTWKVWIVLAHACFMWQYFISFSKSTVISKPAALLMVKDLLFPKVTSVTSYSQNKELFCVFSNMHTVEILYFCAEHKIAYIFTIIKNFQKAENLYLSTNWIHIQPNFNQLETWPQFDSLEKILCCLTCSEVYTFHFLHCKSAYTLCKKLIFPYSL